jgi:hypothetical protein
MRKVMLLVMVTLDGYFDGLKAGARAYSRACHGAESAAGQADYCLRQRRLRRDAELRYAPDQVGSAGA